MKHELTPLSPLFFSCRSPSSHSFPVLSFPSPFSSRPSPLLSPLPLLSAPSLYPFSLQAALEHPWFAEAPLPQEKDKMPSFQVRNRKDGERGRGEDRGRGQGERTGREDGERDRNTKSCMCGVGRLLFIYVNTHTHTSHTYIKGPQCLETITNIGYMSLSFLPYQRPSTKCLETSGSSQAQGG